MDNLPDRIDDSRRQQLNDDLTRAVGQGRIDLAEFSELVDVIWDTTDPGQFGRIEKLVRGERTDEDIDNLAAKAAPPAPRLYDSAPAPLTQAGTTHWFNDITRAGAYQLAERETHTLIASDLTFDLREATLSAPVTVLDITSYFGTINVTVPPGVKVDNRINGVMSDVSEEPGRNVGPSSPTVILTGRSWGGDVSITVRDHGEKLNRSWWDWLTG
ncbi:MAG: hypothetical protein ACTH1D_02860 [Mycobacteriaceae bacterium]|uniref:hypothetical protein n=1 Tax=Corynebacterium sp. TaxID=1720 RepID=UPI003F9964AF